MGATKTYVALLRGINVGGKNKIAMAELKSLFASLGFEDVVTYIQSGNVVFRSASDDADALSVKIEREIAALSGIKPAVLLRTLKELATIAERNPYLSRDADLSKLHVVFLDHAPAKRAATTLDPDRSPGDELAPKGREIYLRLPNGAGRSKLTIDYFERVLGARATQRNWGTLLKLIELSQE
jgi:uncharacterized protein (DUF1697 family)